MPEALDLTWGVYVDWGRDGAFTGTNDNITEYVKNVRCQVGISDLLSGRVADVGRCSITLWNGDQRFSPGNTASPYAASYWTRLPVKVTATVVTNHETGATTTYTVFRGLSASFTPASASMGTRECKLECQDMLSLLQAHMPTIPIQYDQRSDQLVTHVVNDVFRAPAATGTLSYHDTPADNDTVTINGERYTYKTTIAAANDVAIGADAYAAIDNLCAAINGAEGTGTKFYAGTERPEGVSAAPRESYFELVRRSAPIRWYRLAELSGTSAADRGTNNRAGTYVNGTLGSATGISGDDHDYAYLQDGATAQVTFPMINVDSRSFTLSCWFFITDYTVPNTEIVKIAGGIGTGDGASFIVEDDGTFIGGIYGEAGSTAAGGAPKLAWHHALFAYDHLTKAGSLYLDGALTATQPTTSAAGIDTGTSTFETVTTFNGAVDEVALWFRCLSSAEILAQYAARTETIGVKITSRLRGTAGNAYTLAAGSYSHLADTITLTTGTYQSGTVADTHSQNTVYYKIREVAGTPGFDVRFNFTNVVGYLNQVVIRGRYDGSGAHTVNIEAWNGATWDTLAVMPSTGSVNATYTVSPTSSHTLANVCIIRIYHASAGSAAHYLYVDKVSATDTAATVPEDFDVDAATLSGGVDYPAGLTSFETGKQSYSVCGDGWSRINALTALEQATSSEIGMFWAARDGTLTWKNQDYLFKQGSLTPTAYGDDLVTATGDMQALYNRVMVRVSPRQYLATGVIARASDIVEVKPAKQAEDSGALGGNVLRYNGTQEKSPYVTNIRLSYIDPGTGRVVGADQLVLPLEAGTDFQASDSPEGIGGEGYTFDYTHSGHLKFAVSATSGGIEIDAQTATTGPLFVEDLQVRGRAIVAYDPVEMVREDSTSISTYGLRSYAVDMPLPASVQVAEAYANYLRDRYSQPQYRVRELGFGSRHSFGYGNGISLFSMEIGNVLSISSPQLGLSAVKVMITGIQSSFYPGKDGKSEISFNVFQLDDADYAVYDDATLGKYDSGSVYAI